MSGSYSSGSSSHESSSSKYSASEASLHSSSSSSVVIEMNGKSKSSKKSSKKGSKAMNGVEKKPKTKGTKYTVGDGDVTPARGMTWLQFRGVNYTVVTEEDEEKQILFDVSGEVKPGHLVAVMGPTGCGKTTLCNVLQGRTSGTVEGEILVNNEPVTKDIKRTVGYVQQEDCFFGSVTVRSALKFSALMRLPAHLTRAEKLAAVDHVIEELHLESCADTKISLISGGEKKRLSIGEQLLSDPSLIICDEPTSGLDSFTAQHVIQGLKDVATAENRAVIMSIHQPSWKVFALFDTLLLLADGRTVYYGPVDGVMPYLDSLDAGCPVGCNPADWILELVTSDEYAETKAMLIAEWAKRADDIEFDKCTLTGGLQTDVAKFPSSYWQQFYLCAERSFIHKAEATLTWLQLFQMVAVAAIASILWWQLPYKENYIDEFESNLFFSSTTWAFFAIFPAILSFPSERHIINKERTQGTYHLSAYVLGKSISEIPLVTVYPTLFVIISYWAVGLRPSAGAFVIYWLLIFFGTVAAHGLGMALGACFEKLDTALVMTTIVAITMWLSAGFFIDPDNMPPWIRWIDRLSILTLLYEGVYLNHFAGDVTYACANEFSRYEEAGCPIKSSTIVDVSGKNGSIGGSFLGLAIFAVVFNAIAYLGLRYLNKPKSR